ncbi:MAG: 1-(5-phosphoribosyl)-5-[Gomphosphaeria aponina SAG 52.96 = DSM 107014]|uniref:1-(5-phosphoribosyl)-5-[(5-phosphoribosylamino)methylideneamino] imidazole-4-carboxamide isomerase n=1 Tax=Gomphosphaeria aponina SAG 52.96 = DSM 107014 TaxID=1521640 RepID=A0A941GRD2_9CHRO|nr:1-(5-phosphoribosyl)-5-[(5-phosphoribosylamino)methylideneamino]imidazole-4-carboxamide isomerase [Gomphosphaeria aponina SAG 52.96 = DSM 107014]
MDVIPAIDLLEGRCVRLYQGDYAKSQVFSDNPVEVGRNWVKMGATRLHLVDLDGAKQGFPVNTDAISAIVRGVSVPVQVGGGLRDRSSISQLLQLGVERVIVGTIAVENPQLVQDLCTEFPHQIVLGIDARHGKVATRGWLENSEITAIELAQKFEGAAAIIYTDIHRDGTLSGPNQDALRELAQQVEVPVIASGGVSSLTDLLSLLALEPLGVTGVIVGKAIYTGDVNLSEAIKAIGPGRWQDIPPDHGFSTFA